MKFDPPQLRVGGLSGRIYVITHGKEIETPSGPGIEASRKYDVTEQFEALEQERLDGWGAETVRVGTRETLEKTTIVCPDCEGDYSAGPPDEPAVNCKRCENRGRIPATQPIQDGQSSPGEGSDDV